MSSDAVIRIVDVTDEATFQFLPPCADPGFDHRSCDYWEDGVRGSKAARASWWAAAPPRQESRPRPPVDNPFAPAPDDGPSFNPFDPSADAEPTFNPFAPTPDDLPARASRDVPAKLRLLDRGRLVFGSYAKVLLLDDEPAVYAQFGPLSAYPRAQQVRDLYPALPTSPLPAVITCIASTAAARGHGMARLLVEDVVEDLAARGFSAIETYPDLTLPADQASAAQPGFWEACGFELAAKDDRYPVMRRELG